MLRLRSLMDYIDYYKKFIKNDTEDVKQYVPNSECIEFLLDNAPRLYCPDKTIEETFAFRCFTMRKHIMKTDAGFLLSEFLVNSRLPWAGKYNTINAPLTHHLNEFRWLGFSDKLLDYVSFFIKGDGSEDGDGSAFAYSTPALYAMYHFCLVTGNEDYLKENAEYFERYFIGFEKRHITDCGLYKSVDDREGMEYTVSGTTADRKLTEGIRVLMNSCMYGDALALSEIFALSGDPERRDLYKRKAAKIKSLVDSLLWNDGFYRSLHPRDEILDEGLDFSRVAPEQNARELMGYIPWCFALPDEGKEEVFELLFDERIFKAKTGLATVDISHERFMFYHERACTWNGKVWPYATSYAIGAVIELLNRYDQSVVDNSRLYQLISDYANMHYSVENGKRINFIDEVMLPDKPIWDAREKAKRGEYEPTGGKNRGKDYNHSTFIDPVLRGLIGIDPEKEELTVAPRIEGIWSYFKLENLTFRKKKYNIYYDSDGSHLGRGKGVVIEKIN